MMLSFFGKKAIEAYWRMKPASERNVCLFKRSCSREVYAHLDEHGFIRGVITYFRRMSACRSGYRIVRGEDGSFFLKTRNGSRIVEDQINPILLSEFKSGNFIEYAKKEEVTSR